MDEMIFNAIDNVVLESEFDTAYALAQGYLKAIAILESDDVTGEAEGFAIFQESGDDKDKKTKEDKKNEAKGGLINAIKRMFAAIAAKFKKAEEQGDDKVDEKKKSKLKKFGIATGVASATAGALLILNKVKNNRTDAELKDEIRMTLARVTGDKNESVVKKAFNTIDIRNGGKVYFSTYNLKTMNSIFGDVTSFLKEKNPKSEEKATKLISSMDKYNENDSWKDKKIWKEYELSEFKQEYSTLKETVDELEKVLKLVNNYNGENTTASDVDVKVLASLQKLTNRWVEVQQTKAKIVSAIYNLSFHDEQGVKHGLELSGNKLVSVDKKREAFEKITGKGEDYNESKED